MKSTWKDNEEAKLLCYEPQEVRDERNNFSRGIRNEALSTDDGNI